MSSCRSSRSVQSRKMALLQRMVVVVVAKIRLFRYCRVEPGPAGPICWLCRMPDVQPTASSAARRAAAATLSWVWRRVPHRRQRLFKWVMPLWARPICVCVVSTVYTWWYLRCKAPLWTNPHCSIQLASASSVSKRSVSCALFLSALNLHLQSSL